jgi:hypothetical protein
MKFCNLKSLLLSETFLARYLSTDPLPCEHPSVSCTLFGMTNHIFIMCGCKVDTLNDNSQVWDFFSQQLGGI